VNIFQNKNERFKQGNAIKVPSSSYKAREFIFLVSYVLAFIQYYTVKILNGRSVVLLRLVGIVKVRFTRVFKFPKKRLLVASCSSVFSRVTPRLPLDGFS